MVRWIDCCWWGCCHGFVVLQFGQCEAVYKRDQGKIARTDHNKHPLLAAKPELKGPIQGLGSDKPAGRLSGSFSQRQTAQVIRGI
jgi:hypothetical protein